MEPEYVSRWHRKLKEHKKNQICGMPQEELEQQTAQCVLYIWKNWLITDKLFLKSNQGRADGNSQ